MCVTLTAVRRPVGSCSVHTASKWLLKSMEMPLRSPRLFRGNIFNWAKWFKTLRQLEEIQKLVSTPKHIIILQHYMLCLYIV